MNVDEFVVDAEDTIRFLEDDGLPNTAKIMKKALSIIEHQREALMYLSRILSEDTEAYSVAQEALNGEV